jgi:hypothetical protein
LKTNTGSSLQAGQLKPNESVVAEPELRWRKTRHGTSLCAT